MPTTEYTTPWSPIGYIVAKRTYARRLVDDDVNSPTEEWKDVCNRVIEACRTQLNVGFTEGEEERLYRYLMTLKGSVAGRFLWQLGTSTVNTLGLPSLQNCFSGNTKILTQEGTRTLKELSESSTSFKVWANGEWHSAHARSFGTQPLNRVVFKKPGRSTYRFQTEVTGNHRWELLDGTVTDALKVGDRVPRQTVHTEYDQEAFVHGLVFGDGSQSYRYSNGDYSFSVRLCGEKSKYKDLFDKYSYQPNCGGDPVAYIRSSVNLKELPDDQCTPDYIGSFIRGWCAADGSITPNNTIVLSTQNEQAVQWVRENAAYAGMGVTGSTVYTGDTNYGPRSSPLVKIVLSAAPQFMEVEEIHPLGEDEVYCAVVNGVERFTLSNGLLTCNCAFATVDHPVRPFVWAFDMLMLGSGVGYNIQREYVYKLPQVRSDFERPVRFDGAGADFIVPDSRGGWGALLERTLRSAFYGDTIPGFTYSTQLVRGKGAPIRGFGGVASGPEDLCRGIDLIGGILEERAGKQLRPIDCLDIMNILGMIVVSGNVRRSAQIAIGDFDDVQYLRAKDWSSGKVPNWRAFSNNSVVCNDFSLLPQAFWDTYKGGSEPYGLINLKLSQSCGRLGDTKYKDKGVRGYNP